MSWDQNSYFAETAIFPDRIAIYCEVLINYLELDVIVFKDLRPSIFCIFYSFGKLSKYFFNFGMEFIIDPSSFGID